MLNPDYKEMLSIFLEENVDFLLVGAYALAVHGFPRATGDMDIFVAPSKENSLKVFRSLKRFGAPAFKLDEGTFTKPDMVLQIGIAPLRIDIMTTIDGVTFSEASSDAHITDIEGLRVPVLSKANLIRNKKATGREQDRIDAEALLNSDQDAQD